VFCNGKDVRCVLCGSICDDSQHAINGSEMDKMNFCLSRSSILATVFGYNRNQPQRDEGPMLARDQKDPRGPNTVFTEE